MRIAKLTPVVKRERKVDKSLFSPTFLARMVLLHHVVNLRNSRSDQKRQDECEDVPVSRPKVDIDRVEHSKQGESPVDRVDDDFFSTGRKLEYHSAEEEEVDEGPDVECVV